MEPKRNKLDRWLDQVLSDYGHAQPRMGLEIRILSNLAAEKTRVAKRTLWPWAFAGIAVTLTAVVAIWSWVSMQEPRTLTNLANTNTVKQQKGPPVSAKSETQTTAPEKQGKRRQLAKVPELEKSPRLSQFPSVRELSTQEQLLVRYAREFPQQALEVAQAQAAAEQERIRGESAPE
jgi:hypothetical protein